MASREAGSCYELNLPTYYQQGDIILDVPFVRLGAGELLVIRKKERSRPSPDDKDVVLFREKALKDAFEEGAPELIALEVIRGAAVIATPTCDLGGTELWQVCPVYGLVGHPDAIKIKEDVQIDRFYLPKHDYFEESFAELGDLQTVHKSHVWAGNRWAGLKPESQGELADKLAQLFGRFWGFNTQETAPTDGQYRCLRDARYFDCKHETPVIPLQKGSQFPRCPNCDHINKQPQYILLTKQEKKIRPLFTMPRTTGRFE